jgi:hypothetical protein
MFNLHCCFVLNFEVLFPKLERESFFVLGSDHILGFPKKINMIKNTTFILSFLLLDENFSLKIA